VHGITSLAETAQQNEPSADDMKEDAVAGVGEDEETVEVLSAKPAFTAKPAMGASSGEPEVNVLLRKMFQMGASDLHLTANHKPLIRLHSECRNCRANRSSRSTG
jgi:hypothetical protein